MPKPRVALAIFDVDNTLFDWVDVWHASFSTILDGVHARSGLPKERLAAEFRSIHQRHRTTEYASAVGELPSLQKRHPDADLLQLYRDVLLDAEQMRRQRLKLYPTVLETLEAIASEGTRLAAYTESMECYAAPRLKSLNLDRLFDRVYLPEHQEELSAEAVPLKCERRYVSADRRKPDPTVLRDIARDLGIAPDLTIYVGDSLTRDMAMARRAGMTAVWASYGARQDRAEYSLLREVVHWTEEDLTRERSSVELHGAEILKPHVTLNDELGELLDLFEFGSL